MHDFLGWLLGSNLPPERAPGEEEYALHLTMYCGNCLRAGRLHILGEVVWQTSFWRN